MTRARSTQQSILQARTFCVDTSDVEPTTSYEEVIPASTLDRYDLYETRNAAAILAATNPQNLGDILTVLDDFAVDVDRDIRQAGRNESATAASLNQAFRQLGWREGRYNLRIVSELQLLPFGDEPIPERVVTEVPSPSYLIDNVLGRVALDVEWHAKDGNLDRDIAAYRALYEAGFIDVAVMVTMRRESMREWARDILGRDTKKFQTSTTTNLEKVVPRLSRGDGGGCPILIIAIGRRTT